MTIRLLLLSLCLLLCTSTAQAGMILGIAPESSSALGSRTAAELLTSYLSRQLDDAVELRIFRNQETLLRWVSRYREVDLALIPRTLYEKKQSGMLIHLVDFVPHTAGSGQTVTTLIARRGLAPDLLQRLRNLVLVMDTEPVGAEFLSGYSIEQYPSPQARISLPQPAEATLPTPQSKPVEAKQPKAVKRKTEAKVTDIAMKSPPLPSKPANRPAAATPAPPSELPPPSHHRAADPAQSAGAPLAKLQLVHAPESEASPAEVGHISAPPPVQAPQSPARTEPPATPQIDSPTQPKLLWIIVSVLTCGLLIKLLLLARGRPRSRPLKHSPQLLIQHDWAELQGTPTEKARSNSDSAVFAHETLQAKLKEASGPGQPPPSQESGPDMSLGGKLTSSQVPAMLQFIAASNRVGTLVVRSEHNEKRISFCRGKIVAASSVSTSNQNQTGFLMNKLGYLLIRQGKISEDDRDRALVLCEGDPDLRLGEALIRLEVMRREQLQKSLQDQAKMVLHSMIVFPEGEFQFKPEQTSVPLRDSLEISVADFLKEAASHQGEWRSIRQLIPSLDCVLQFAPEGREKINNSRMTVHQKFVLSLIDGQRPIREICNEATMLDYELYRFLYLMVKANILQLSD